MNIPNYITHSKIYTKYEITDGSQGIVAKVSGDKISFKNHRGQKAFIFENSDKEKAERIIRMMLRAFELE